LVHHKSAIFEIFEIFTVDSSSATSKTHIQYQFTSKFSILIRHIKSTHFLN